MRDLFSIVCRQPSWDQNSRKWQLSAERLFRTFEKYLGRDCEPGDFSDEVVAGFAEWLPRQKNRSAVPFSAKTVREAVKVVRRVWKLAHDQGLAPPTSRRPKLGRPIYELPPAPENDARDLVAFFERVYWPRKIGRASHTRKLYVITLRLLARWLGRRPTLDDLADDVVLHGYLQDRLSTSSAPSANRCRTNLLAIGNFAFKKSFISACPDVERIPEHDVQPEAWTLDRLRQLLAACRAETRAMDGLPGGDWWYAIHLFALDTGERARATLSLRWEWVDRINGWVDVPGAARKGRKKSMRYKLRAETLAAINGLWREGRERVFLSHDRQIPSFYYRYKQMLKRAALPSGRRFKLQKMRRTFASLVERAGGDATRALGHSSRNVTERSYLDEKLIARKPSVEFIELAIGDALATECVIGVEDSDERLPVAEVIHAQ